MPWFTHVPIVCTQLCLLVIFSPLYLFLDITEPCERV